MPFGYDSGFDTATLDTLSSVGVTAAQTLTGANMTFQVTVSGIGTNVVVRFEGSLDGTNFFNLSSANVDTTITANGTYGYALSGCPVQFARLRLVSISGGTPSVATVLGVS
jgi:hypothetical protein